MAKADEIDLAYRVLDLDLVDCEGIRCGKVDDLELSGAPGELSYVTAIQSGSGAFAPRVVRPLRGILSRIFGETTISVPWHQVEAFDASVTLSESARELGLGAGDRRLTSLFHGEGKSD